MKIIGGFATRDPRAVNPAAVPTARRRTRTRQVRERPRRSTASKAPIIVPTAVGRSKMRKLVCQVGRRLVIPGKPQDIENSD